MVKAQATNIKLDNKLYKSITLSDKSWYDVRQQFINKAIQFVCASMDLGDDRRLFFSASPIARSQTDDKGYRWVSYQLMYGKEEVVGEFTISELQD